jgi:hypothetical protein
MPWIIGIDEAGYGPNLGPLVMTSVACRVPDGLAGRDLWQVLRAAVRRPGEPDDGRLLVEDSKVVYSTARGLAALETGVLGTLSGCPGAVRSSLAECVGWLAPDGHAELKAERWFSGASALPVAAPPDEWAAAAARFTGAVRDAGIEWARVRSVVVCPARFNRLVDEAGSKGAVLGHGLAELVRWNCRGEGAEAVDFFVDKHGGRNTYAPLLQDAFEEGMVVAQTEGMARSTYHLVGAPRPVRVTFQPRADAEHFCVALASMVSKYLREVLMLEFNAFWQTQVPGLKPTAGYPGDAGRYFEAIKPAVERLGLSEAAVWRRK